MSHSNILINGPAFADLVIRAGSVYPMEKEKSVYRARDLRRLAPVFTMVGGKPTFDPENLITI